MGELVGLPEWLVRAIFVGAVLIVVFGLAGISLSKARTRLAERRLNPTEAEFIAMMQPDTGEDAARFLWTTTLPYLEPQLTPHPDDHLGDDLRIDDDDWGMDWPVEWARQRGFHESNLPDWPREWPATIRNYGKWLAMGAVA